MKDNNEFPPIKTSDIIEELKKADATLDMDGYKGFCYSRLAIGMAIKRLTELSTASNQIDIASESQAVPFQKCPKCDGQGIVAKPPFIAGDVHQWSSTSVTFPCDVCNGAKIISMNHIIK